MVVLLFASSDEQAIALAIRANDFLVIVYLLSVGVITF